MHIKMVDNCEGQKVDEEVMEPKKISLTVFCIASHIWSHRRLVFVFTICSLLVSSVLAAVFYIKKSEIKEPRSKKLISSSQPWLNMRLPKSIVPNTYDIELDVDMEKNTYKGIVAANVSIVHETNLIIFHKVGIIIANVVVRSAKAGRQIVVVNQFAYEPNEFYVVKLNSQLRKAEQYQIEIVFSGKMRTDLSGFYTSFYNDGKRQAKVASTFFSPISARKAFPCFDEPMFKANFSLTLMHRDKYKAISNMPVYSTLYKEGNVTTKFHTTLKMSTYILCWVISGYTSLGNKGYSPPRIQGWTSDNSLNDMQYGLDVSNKLLHFYEDYFQISYPLKKLDIVSIPSFGPGGMENWGIITFRPERILINKESASEDDRQKSLSIIAHELVHQWFGNLVTMEFWTEAWLKEGFANNVGVIGADYVDSTMGVKEEVLTKFMLPAMEIDSYSTSHPISASLQSPSEIRQVFDLITYNKGSCIVDLLHEYLGKANFRRGMQHYLKTYSYKNTNQDELWEQFSSVSGKNVKSLMDTWTKQLGYPVVSVRRRNATHVEIRQKRFSLDPPNTIPPKSPFDYVWKIPVIFTYQGNDERKTFLLEKEAAVVNISDDILLLNPNHSLYYRVKYDEQMMNSIKSILIKDPGTLTSRDKTGLISDQFSFVKASMTKIGKVLDMLNFLKKETDYFPWKVALDQLGYINSMIESKVMKEKFNLFLRMLTAGVLKKVDWGQTKSVEEGSLQVLMLNQACKTDTASVVSQANQYFKKWVTGSPMKIRPSLLPVMRDCAISHGPSFYWDFTFLKYKQRGADSDSILWSLTSTRDAKILEKLLNYTLDNDVIDNGNAPYLIAEVATRSLTGKNACWEFLKRNWKIILNAYGDQLFLLPTIISSILDTYSSDKDLREIENFFADKDLGSGAQAYEQAINKIKANILWKRNNFKDLSDWLNQHGF